MNETILPPNDKGEGALCEIHQPPSPYEIPIAEMVARYEKLYTGAVIDIFQELGLHNQWGSARNASVSPSG